jgi:hypothetical protein
MSVFPKDSSFLIIFRFPAEPERPARDEPNPVILAASISGRNGPGDWGVNGARG